MKNNCCLFERLFKIQKKGVMNTSGAKFEEHCFKISRDILYSVFYHFSCKPHDVITFLICIIQKREYLINEKKYSRKENAVPLYFEKPLK